MKGSWGIAEGPWSVTTRLIPGPEEEETPTPQKQKDFAPQALVMGRVQQHVPFVSLPMGEMSLNPPGITSQGRESLETL